MTELSKFQIEGSFLPVDPSNKTDIRVRLMNELDISKERMAEVWLIAMRVQCSIQNSAKEITEKRGGGKAITTDDQYCFMTALAVGLGLGLRNIKMPNEQFQMLVMTVARIANLIERDNLIEGVADANGHPVEPRTIN